MATRTRNTKSTTDDRKPNVQPNTMPAGIRLVAGLAGVDLFAITLQQNAKLSPSGAVTYTAAIKKGWLLPGTWMDALKALTFEAGGTTLKVAASGVHQSDAGNPTVGHFAMLDLDDSTAEGGTVKYQVQVYATWLGEVKQYSLSARAFPFALKPGTPGPQVIGEVQDLSGGLILNAA